MLALFVIHAGFSFRCVKLLDILLYITSKTKQSLDMKPRRNICCVYLNFIAIIVVKNYICSL